MYNNHLEVSGYSPRLKIVCSLSQTVQCVTLRYRVTLKVICASSSEQYLTHYLLP